MRSRAECIDLAMECEEMAARSSSPTVKATYAKIAQTWRKLSDVAETVSRDQDVAQHWASR